MKRILAAALLLLVAVGISLWGQWQIHRDTADLHAITAELQRQAESGDFQKAEQTAGTLQARWDACVQRLCLLLNHGALEDCQQSIVLLPQMCRDESKADILSACTLLQYQLEHLAHSEQPRWENVF